MVAETPDLNDEEAVPERRARLSGLTRWLIALGLVVFFITLSLVSTAINDTTAPLATQVDQLRATLTAAPQPLPARDQIGAAMLQFRQNTEALTALSGTLTAQHIVWPDVLSRLATYDPALMNLTGIAQSAGQIVVQGQAADENVVLEFTNRLRQSDVFANVVVQSITLKSAAARASARNSSPYPDRDQYAEFVFTVKLSTS